MTESEGQKKQERQRDRDKERKTLRETERHGDRDRETQRERPRQTETDREGEGWRLKQDINHFLSRFRGTCGLIMIYLASDLHTARAACQSGWVWTKAFPPRSPLAFQTKLISSITAAIQYSSAHAALFGFDFCSHSFHLHASELTLLSSFSRGRGHSLTVASANFCRCQVAR